MKSVTKNHFVQCDKLLWSNTKSN